MGHVGGKGDLVQGTGHHLDPTIARPLIDGKRGMPLSKSGMATLFDIAIWPAKSADQEVPEPFLRAVHVVSRIHRPKDVVTGNLGIKRPHEARKALFANLLVNLKLANLHGTIRNHRVKMSSEAIFTKITSELIFIAG